MVLTSHRNSTTHLPDDVKSVVFQNILAALQKYQTHTIHNIMLICKPVRAVITQCHQDSTLGLELLRLA